MTPCTANRTKLARDSLRVPKAGVEARGVWTKVVRLLPMLRFCTASCWGRGISSAPNDL
jgi:hypothetical protein